MGIRGHEPLVLQRCPEGEGDGAVLACTTESCGIYDDVLEVPALQPAELEVAFTVPAGVPAYPTDPGGGDGCGCR